MITIAVDAMGGDFGLDVTIPGIAAFLKFHPQANLLIVGDESKITNALTKAEVNLTQIKIVHATEVVNMDETPQSALKNKKNSSMRVAINQVKEGNAQAAVSAGNTGALMATARFVLKTIVGIERPAIAKFLPNWKGGKTLMLDLGANVDCTPLQLEQFAILGSELVQSLSKNDALPRVGLLNIGTEDIKGNDVVKQTYHSLSQSNLNFIGNVEGDDIFKGDVDVVVSDGFVGNIVLKTIEGAVKYMSKSIKEEFHSSFYNKLIGLIALPALKGLKRKLDPRRFNGAIFLGLRGVVIKSHGGTDPKGFSYALTEAYDAVRSNSIVRAEQQVSARLSSLQKEIRIE